MMETKISPKKITRIVIVGGGVSARLLVKNLRSLSKKKKDNSIEITLIQSNRFSEIPFYLTEVLTDKDTFHGNSTNTPIADIDRTVFGVAESCRDGILSVRPLDEDEEQHNVSTISIPFDVIVCATGSNISTIQATPGQSSKERQAEIDTLSKLLTSPNSHVVIGGGGAIGIELAGDAAEAKKKYSGTGKVTLVCSADRLISDATLDASQKAKQYLESLGCQIYLNERVVSHDQTTTTATELVLKSGETISCDAYITAYSRGANTSWINSSEENGEQENDDGTSSNPLPPGILSKQGGSIMVDDYLCSKAYPKLYALASTNDKPTPSIIPHMEEEAHTITINVLAGTNIKSHKPPPINAPIIYLAGRDYGIIVPEHAPKPMGVVCFKWCGFPCNMLLCPCFACGVCCGPCDAFFCGWCCGDPSGAGVPKTFAAAKKKGYVRDKIGYEDIGGKGTKAPKSMEIDRTSAATLS